MGIKTGDIVTFEGPRGEIKSGIVVEKADGVVIQCWWVRDGDGEDFNVPEHNILQNVSR